MAASDIVKHLYDGSIKALDGTSGTAVELEIPFTVGDFSVQGLQETQRATVAYESRGVLNSVRKAARTYPTGSFTFQIADYSDGTDKTALDYFLKRGSYSANVSTLGTNSDVYTTDLVFTVAGTVLGDAADHVATLEDCDVVVDFSEGEPNTGTISWTCYGDYTIT
jgi:hypothetical protein